MNHNSPFHAAAELWSSAPTSSRRRATAPSSTTGSPSSSSSGSRPSASASSGESGPFIEEGNTRLGGTIPVNTDGGACNFGRRHGANFCIESVRQLRGECGDRQVPDAEVGVWANAVGPFSGAVLMTKDR